jgi:hypothetical protein
LRLSVGRASSRAGSSVARPTKKYHYFAGSNATITLSFVLPVASNWKAPSGVVWEKLQPFQGWGVAAATPAAQQRRPTKDWVNTAMVLLEPL